MKRALFFLLAISSSYISIAQKGKAELSLTLRDGNVITGTSNITKVDLETKYGKLQIPIKNVSAIEVGITANTAKKNDIIKLVNELNNSIVEIREKAYSELLEMGSGAIPIISDYVFSDKYMGNEQTDFTPESVISELKAMYNIKEAYSTEDVIAIDHVYSMGGKYDFNKIDLKTEYGNLSIPKEKIERVDVMYHEEGDGSEKVYKLVASKHISGNQNGGWLNTGIMVKTGQRIRISAYGEITLASLSNKKYLPNGTVVGDEKKYNSYESTYLKYGNVAYRIGETGQAQKAGDNYTGVAKSTGMLYLSIYETVYNSSNSGFYTVKVKVN